MNKISEQTLLMHLAYDYKTHSITHFPSLADKNTRLNELYFQTVDNLFFDSG